MLKPISFFKMSGCGNDFILIDHRRPLLDANELSSWAERLCRRKLDVGADGLILIEPSQTADFKWQFFNADGSRAEMCGNGARCAARYAFLQGIAGPSMCFETDAGLIRAEVNGEKVKIRLTDPRALVLDERLQLEQAELRASSINTGVPHVVIAVEDIEAVDVIGTGRSIRCHARYAPAGTNVNFMARRDDGRLVVRTYERGVEDETLACGTGAAACALVAARSGQMASPVAVQVRSGGWLTIHFTSNNGRFKGVHLEGDARVVYTGTLWQKSPN